MNGQNLIARQRRRRNRGARRRAAGTPGPRPRPGLFGGSIFGVSLREQIIARLNFPIFVFRGGPGIGPPAGQPPGALNFRSPNQPLPGVPQVQPRFPVFTPQTTDVVFRRNPVLGASRLFGVGGLIIAGAAVLINELERQQKEKIDRRLEEIDRDIAENAAARARRLERDTPVRADRLPTINPEPTQPFRIFPPFRQPQRVSPSPDVVRPPASPTEIVPLPIEVAPVVVPSIPGVRPVIPNPAPVVAPSTAPFPGQFESPNPFGIPNPEPSLFPSPGPAFFIGDLLPDFEPVVDPLTDVRPDTVPSGGSLPGTGVGPVGIGVGVQPLPGLDLAARPQTGPVGAGTATCPPRTCDDELDEPRFECFKGLYKEGVFDTSFTSWAEIDCLTGKEI